LKSILKMRLTVLAIINILLVIIGVIIVIVSVSYLPSTGGTVPQDMSLENYRNQQQLAIYNSNAFKGVIAGCVIAGISIILGLVRIYLDNQRNIREYQARISPEDPRPRPNTKAILTPSVNTTSKSILKVTRINEP